MNNINENINEFSNSQVSQIDENLVESKEKENS